MRSPGGGTRFCASAMDGNGSLGELAPPAVWKSKQGATRVHEQPGPKSTKLDFGQHIMVARKRDPHVALSGGGTRFCASAVDGNGSLGELAPPADGKGNQGQHGFMNSLDQNRPGSILVTTLWSRGSATLPGRSPGGGTRFCASAMDGNGSLGELAPPADGKGNQGQHGFMNSLDQNRPGSILGNALSPHFAGAEASFSWRVEPSKTSGNANVFCNLTRVRHGPAPGGGTISPRLRRRFSGLRRRGASDSFHPAGRGARPRQPKDPPATDTLTTI